MKENTNFMQIKVLGRLLDQSKWLLTMVAVFSAAFILTACNVSSRFEAPDNKLEINSTISESLLEEKSGFFFPTNSWFDKLLDPNNKDGNQSYAFHIANYALNSSGQAALSLDNANAEKQIKVSFLIKKKQVEKLADLIGEYKGSANDSVVSEVKIYTQNSYLLLKVAKTFLVKITSVDKDIVTGEIEMEDTESKPNKIKGKFVAKLISNPDNTNGNSNK